MMGFTPPAMGTGPGWRAAVAVVAAVAVTASCSGDDSSPSASESGAGAELYAQSCASCHGSDLRGTDVGPPHLSQVYAPDHHPDESFRAAITQGTRAHHWDFGDMAPVEGLTDEEIDQVIAFVREQQEIHGLEPYPPR